MSLLAIALLVFFALYGLQAFGVFTIDGRIIGIVAILIAILLLVDRRL